MMESVAGINIADGVVSAARIVRHGRHKIVLTHAGCMEYAPDASDAEIVQVVRWLWKKTRMPTRMVCNGLHCQSLCLKYFKYPDLAPCELASALNLEAEESLQLPPDQIALDWHLNRPLNNPYTQHGDQMHGVLVAVKKATVVQQLNLLKKCGLFPVAIDVGSTALCNLYLKLCGEKVHAGNAICVINFSRFHADVTILYDEHYIYPRTIISRSSEWSSKVQYLIENISDALLYYHVKVDKVPVTRLVLTGLVPDSPEFTRHVQGSIGLPVEVWDPLEEKKLVVAHGVKATVKEEGFLHHITTSLGLAVRSV